MRSKRFFWLGLMAAGFFALTACDGSGGTKTEICDNEVDDTGNGLTDCDDPDCENFSACQETDPCQTVDDCDDPQCYDETVCQNICLTDCSHPACTNHANCQSTDDEICDNQIDDDENGFTDCEDAACANDPACQGGDEDLSCMGVNYCYNCCGNAGQTCYDACDAAGSDTATSQMDAIFSCMSTNCPTECGQGGTQEGCNTCLETNCSSEMDACDWDPQGATTCTGLSTCLNGCSGTIPQGTGTPQDCTTNATILCYGDCFGDADQDAIDKFFAYNECYWDNCETACQGTDEECSQCIQDNCSAEGTACQND